MSQLPEKKPQGGNLEPPQLSRFRPPTSPPASPPTARQNFQGESQEMGNPPSPTLPPPAPAPPRPYPDGRSSSAPHSVTHQAVQAIDQQSLSTYPPAPVITPTVVQEDSIQSIIEEDTRRAMEQRLEELLANEKSQEKTHIEELTIPPGTPTRGMRAIAPPLDNPFASPGFKSVEKFEPSMEKGPEGISTNPSALPPPSTLLREQTLPNTSIRHNGERMEWAKYQNTPEYISKHPKCALNLVCYRTGTNGCELHQIQTVLESRFDDKQAFKQVIEETPSLIFTDAQFFQALRDVYQDKMCGFWRKALFLKTLRGIRLLSFTPTTRPAIVPLNDFILQELLYAYQNPSKITSEHEWIDWVFRLRQPDRRHALEFVEGWNGTRIAAAGSILLVISTLVGVVWSVKGSGIQDGFSIAGFILTAGSILLALLAIISGIESSSGKQNN